MTAQRRERFRQAVRRDLVVARHHPDLAADLDPDLRRAGDVAGRMEADGGAADPQVAAVGHGLDRGLAKPEPQDRRRAFGAEISSVAGPRMVGMAMRDERAIDRPPRIDVETACGAKEAALGKAEDVWSWHDPATRARAVRLPQNPARAAEKLCRTRWRPGDRRYLPFHRRRRCLVFHQDRSGGDQHGCSVLQRDVRR